MMSKNIKKLKVVFVLFAFMIFSIGASAQNDKSTEDLRAVIATHVGQTITNKMLSAYTTTSEDNLAMFKAIQTQRANHPNFNASQIANLIAGMERKLASSNK